ncbi:ATP-grasp domain-containing protein [Nostoc parmelioides]|uniref:ATP-grasp domain-containing protein n=1 Tax=Nostoc parmelioides FACHB-3921 TaxID=2692909 RepID=A0ABR8BQI6_9NOSO|nr:ATP-grasp domain-containing protein [Nostoc parmelioides]MBD2255547.1 ATP-grasp domain-containing protein [Nostoc parmelioides FACHB-3921]
MNKKIVYVYSVGGPPVDYFYPKLAQRGDIYTFIVSTASEYNRNIIERYSQLVEDFSNLTPTDALKCVYQRAVALSPDALFTFAEFILKDVSEIAEKIGVRGVGKNVDLARNKVLMRERWAEVGIPQPKFCAIKKLSDIAKTKELTTPFIIKVAYGAGSIAMQKVERHEETEFYIRKIIEVIEIARKTGDHEFSEDSKFPVLIAEEIIRSTTNSWYDESDYGDFVSVEGLVRDGLYYPLAMTGRLKTVPPFTELGNLAPCILTDDKKAKIVALVTQAINALGLENCATHTELKLKANNEVSFLETAARMGGVGIAKELYDVYGFDFVDLFFSILLNEGCEIPQFESTTPKCGAASVALIGCNANGQPWSSNRVFRTDSLDWNTLTNGHGTIEILMSQSISQGSAFPIYDFETGVLNYAGQAYLVCEDQNKLKDTAYLIINNLEDSLPFAQKSLLSSDKH